MRPMASTMDAAPHGAAQGGEVFAGRRDELPPLPPRHPAKRP